jgi:CheY-like chemotaxis protein
VDALATLTELRCIVLVDDNEYDNEFADIILRKAGYGGPLVTYTTGDEALTGLATGDPAAPDLLLLDINMPGMDGFEFAERLAATTSSLAPPVVVMLTSSSDPAEFARAASIPIIRGVITKPLSASAILELVSRLDSPPPGATP